MKGGGHVGKKQDPRNYEFISLLSLPFYSFQHLKGGREGRGKGRGGRRETSKNFPLLPTVLAREIQCQTKKEKNCRKKVLQDHCSLFLLVGNFVSRGLKIKSRPTLVIPSRGFFWAEEGGGKRERAAAGNRQDAEKRKKLGEESSQRRERERGKLAEFFRLWEEEASPPHFPFFPRPSLWVVKEGGKER